MPYVMLRPLWGKYIWRCQGVLSCLSRDIWPSWFICIRWLILFANFHELPSIIRKAPNLSQQTVKSIIVLPVFFRARILVIKMYGKCYDNYFFVIYRQSRYSNRISIWWITYCLPFLKTLNCGDRVISVWLGQYHGCWCTGSLRRQDISSHDIDYVE